MSIIKDFFKYSKRRVFNYVFKFLLVFALMYIGSLVMYIPNTFAHGFTVLEDDTELEYLTDNYYNSAAAKSIQFDDSFYNHGKGIDWSVNNTVELNLINRSEKNRKAPGLMDADY